MRQGLVLWILFCFFGVGEGIRSTREDKLYCCGESILKEALILRSLCWIFEKVLNECKLLDLDFRINDLLPCQVLDLDLLWKKSYEALKWKCLNCKVAKEDVLNSFVLMEIL